jgi:hypothetical protein
MQRRARPRARATPTSWQQTQFGTKLRLPQQLCFKKNGYFFLDSGCHPRLRMPITASCAQNSAWARQTALQANTARFGGRRKYASPRGNPTVTADYEKYQISPVLLVTLAAGFSDDRPAANDNRAAATINPKTANASDEGSGTGAPPAVAESDNAAPADAVPGISSRDKRLDEPSESSSLARSDWSDASSGSAKELPTASDSTIVTSPGRLVVPPITKAVWMI